MTLWHTGGPPPEHGYYLGAWERRGEWVVSELWFNPDGTGTGWWSSRGYFGQNSTGREAVAVEAWMPMPAYEPTAALLSKRQTEE